MNALQQALADDLEQKLRLDLGRAIKHYADMGVVAELPTDEIEITILTTATRLLVSLGVHMEVPKKVMLAALLEAWASEKERKQ